MAALGPFQCHVGQPLAQPVDYPTAQQQLELARRQIVREPDGAFVVVDHGNDNERLPERSRSCTPWISMRAPAAITSNPEKCPIDEMIIAGRGWLRQQWGWLLHDADPWTELSDGAAACPVPPGKRSVERASTTDLTTSDSGRGSD